MSDYLLYASGRCLPKSVNIAEVPGCAGLTVIAMFTPETRAAPECLLEASNRSAILRVELTALSFLCRLCIQGEVDTRSETQLKR